MKKIICSILMVFALTVVQAQVDRSIMPKSGPSPEIKLQEPQTFSLKNGLQIMVVENHKLPRVSIQLTMDNSPVLEANKAGVSGLTGALLGNGSTTIDKDSFNEEIDFMGARMSFGSESAFASSLSQYFPRMVELMADAAINPNFTEEEFAKEKAKLLTGLKAGEKDVSAIAQRVSYALAYGKNHPYGEFTNEKSVNEVTLADVKKFYTNNFVPGNAYLVVVGDVTFDKVKSLVETHFVGWTKAMPPSFNYTEPSNAQFTRINFVDMPNAVQSEIYVQNLAKLKMNDADYIPAVLANYILGGGGQSRLFQNLREDKAYTYGSYSSLGNDKNVAALFRASASVRNVVTDSSVVEMLKEIDKITKNPVSEKELASAKAKYIGNFVLALEKPATVAGYALNIKTESLPSDFYQKYLERVNAVTTADILRTAKKYFSPNNAQIIVVGKGSEVVSNLEKIRFNNKSVPLFFFDKEANKTEKLDFNVKVEEGVTAKSILEKYIATIGGKEKLEAVKTYAYDAEAEMQGMKLNMAIKGTNRNQYFMDIKMMGNSMSKQVLNGDKGYMEIQGQRKELDKDMLISLKRQSVPFPELNYVNQDIALEGAEMIDGKKAYKLKVSSKKTAFYDAESGLKVQEDTVQEMQGQTMNQTLILKDYKEVSGIKFPHSMSQTMGPQKIDFIVTKVQINEGVSSENFN